MRALRALAPVGEARTRARTADADVRVEAERAGLVGVGVASVASPLGELFVAVTKRGLACIAFEGEDRDTLERRFAAVLSPSVLSSAGATDEVRRQLEEYFAGERRRFELPLDRRLMSPFARRVLSVTSKVPFGRIDTYGHVALGIQQPTASRAVGAALGSNPIPIVIPCHRIVGSGGRLTGYAGGIDRKRTLLRLEGHRPSELAL